MCQYLLWQNNYAQIIHINSLYIISTVFVLINLYSSIYFYEIPHKISFLDRILNKQPSTYNNSYNTWPKIINAFNVFAHVIHYNNKTKFIILLVKTVLINLIIFY